MNILVIGGTRFVGLAAVQRLADMGHSLRLFHRGQTRAKLPKGVVEIFADRKDLGEYIRDLDRLQLDVVLDMMLLNESQAQELVRLMTGITKRLVMISSCDVYRNYGLLKGMEPDTEANHAPKEDDPLRTTFYPYRSMATDENDPMYDYDKILAEKVVMSQDNLPATVLRLPMVYGPGDYRHRFFGYLKRMVDKRPAILLGEEQADWKITKGYRDNCADAVVSAVVDEKAAGRVYNVGEQTTLSEREWIEKLAEMIGWKGKIVLLPESELSEHLETDENWAHHLEVDTSRIRTELGFSEYVDLNTALRHTMEWELANPPDDVDLKKQYAAEDLLMSGISI